MTADSEGTEMNRAEELRREFDRTFAEAPREAEDALENLIVFRVGGDPYAARLSEISGLFLDKKVVTVPTEMPWLLGITALRTGVLPVYGLRALLGYPAPGESTRWLLHARELGLGFDAFERYLRVPRSALSPARDESSGAHVRDTARIGDASYPVLSIASIVQRIEHQATQIETMRER